MHCHFTDAMSLTRHSPKQRHRPNLNRCACIYDMQGSDPIASQIMYSNDPLSFNLCCCGKHREDSGIRPYADAFRWRTGHFPHGNLVYVSRLLDQITAGLAYFADTAWRALLSSSPPAYLPSAPYSLSVVGKNQIVSKKDKSVKNAP